MVSIWGFAERLSADVFLQWCEAASVEVERATFAGLQGRELAGATKALNAQLDQASRDRMQSDFHRAARVTDARLALAFWAALGTDQELSDELEALASPEDRGLWLIAKQPEVFERVEIVTAFADHSLRRWRGYHLSKDFSRSWTPAEINLDELKDLASLVIAEVELATREVEIETFDLAAAGKEWKGGQSYYFVIHIPDRTERAGEWEDRRRVTRVRTPDRRIDLVISPHAKTLEIVGSGGISVKLLEGFTDRVAFEILKQTQPLNPFKRRKFHLDALRKRPRFLTHREHGIKAVTVTKLVVGSGTGTVTYWAPVQKSGDVYDVIASSPGRSIGGKTIVAATIRVVFDPLPGSKRERRLTLDITLPNSSSLREEQPLDQVIIGTYLREWGLLDAEEVQRSDQAALAELVELLRAPDRIAITADDVEQRLAPCMSWFKSVGILERSANPTGLLCCDCSPPHPVEPLEESAAVGPRFICPIAGDLAAGVPTSECYTLNREAVANTLRVALKADPMIFREVREGSLWCLGVINEPRPWTAFLAFDLTNKEVFRDILVDLDGPLGKEPGLVITVSELPLEIKLPNQHRLTQLASVFRLTPTGFEVLPGIERALAGKLPARKRGPKSRKLEAQDLLQSRREHGLALADADDETRAVMAELKASRDAGIPDFKEVRYVWLKDQFD